MRHGSFSLVSSLPYPTSTPQVGLPVKSKTHGIDELRRNYERTLIMIALQKNNWNRRLAAEMLKITRRGLTYKMRALHIDVKAIPRDTSGPKRKTDSVVGEREEMIG